MFTDISNSVSVSKINLNDFLSSDNLNILLHFHFLSALVTSGAGIVGY